MKTLMDFWNEEDGLGTVEMIVLIAALVSVALILGAGLKTYIGKAGKTALDDGKVKIDEKAQSTYPW